MYKIGQVVNGKVWSGDDYGFQSPATYNKLKQQGAFKRGASAVRRIKQSVQRFYEKNAPQQVKDAVKWYSETDERETKRLKSRGYTQKQIDAANAERSRLSMGTGAADQKMINFLSDKTKIAPEIVSGAVTLTTGLAEGKLGTGAIKRQGQNRIKKRLLSKGSVQKGQTLFHGTSDEAAAAITKDGFKPSGKTTGVFGRGVYNTDNDYYASAYATEAAYGARNPNAKGVLFYGKLPGGVRILDLSDTGLNPKALEKKIGVKDLATWVEKQGYQGVKFKPISGGVGNDEFLIFDSKLADQLYGTGIHASGQPFPSQGSKSVKQRIKPRGSGSVATRQSEGKGISKGPGSQSYFGSKSVGAAEKPPSQRIKTRLRNQQYQQFADQDDAVTAYRGKDGKVRVSKSSLPGQQPLKGRRPKIELDMDLMDADGNVPPTDAPTPEVKRQRIKQRLLKREMQGERSTDNRYVSYEEQNVLLDKERRAGRAVSPITKRPTRRGITPIDTKEPKLPKSRIKPKTGSPITRTEQRAFDKLRAEKLGQRLTASEKKQLSNARKQLADEPRDWETRQFIERLERKRDGIQFRGEAAVDPKYIPGTVQGGTKRQANENLKRDLEKKAAKARITAATRRRMSKENSGRMASNDTLDQYPTQQVIRDEYTGEWQINTKADAAKFLDQLEVNESKARVDNFNQRTKARNALRTKQYEYVYKELLPVDLTKAKRSLEKNKIDNLRRHNVSESEIADSIAGITRDDIKRHAYWLREQEFAKKFGYLDEARVTPGMLLKTDNRAGKESIRRQFRDARSRRGSGDTKVRGKDRIRSRMQGPRRPSAEDVSPRQDVLRPVQRNQSGSDRRTVPVGPTVLDQIGQPQGKPRKGGRIRKRFIERQIQRRKRIKRQR